MRSISYTLPTLFAVLALGACAPVEDRPGPIAAAEDQILVSVGPCFGFCPVYDVAIAPDGSVTFDGKRHTEVLGTRTRSAGKSAYEALARDLASYRPASGASEKVPCESMITDTSTYSITWIDAAGRKSIATHSRGCSGGPGQALDKLLETVPVRLGIEAWAKQVTRPGASRG
jgi:hypothetical protein